MATDTKAAYVRIGPFSFTPAEVREQLAAQGLRVVTAADKEVLDAAGAWWDACEAHGDLESTERGLASAVSRARREAARGK